MSLIIVDLFFSRIRKLKPKKITFKVTQDHCEVAIDNEMAELKLTDKEIIRFARDTVEGLSDKRDLFKKQGFSLRRFYENVKVTNSDIVSLIGCSFRAAVLPGAYKGTFTFVMEDMKWVEAKESTVSKEG